MKQEDALYPIREVSKLTGINPITLRAWERRYELIDPIRTETGHRLYSEVHIQKIKQAIHLTEQGVPISKVKPLIENMAPNPQVLEHDIEDVESQVNFVKEQALKYDLDGLHSALDAVFSDLPDDLLNQLIRQTTIQLLQENARAADFWESVVLPRLYTRFRQSIRSLPKHLPRRVWIQGCTRNESQVLLMSVANWFVHQGIYPHVQFKSENDPAELFNNIKKIKAQSLAIVHSDKTFNDTLWKIWTDTHASLEFYYFIDQEDESELSTKIQCRGFNLNSQFL